MRGEAVASHLCPRRRPFCVSFLSVHAETALACLHFPAPVSVASGSRTASPTTAGPGSETGAVGMRRGRPRLRLRCPRQLQEPFTAICAGSVLGLLRPAGGRPGPPSQRHSDRPNRRSQRPETPRLACGPPRSPGRAGRREKLCQGGPQAEGEEQRSPGGRPAGASGGRAPGRGVRGAAGGRGARSCSQCPPRPSRIPGAVSPSLTSCGAPPGAALSCTVATRVESFK